MCQLLYRLTTLSGCGATTRRWPSAAASPNNARADTDAGEIAFDNLVRISEFCAERGIAPECERRIARQRGKLG
jgi:hypothetical protein